MKKIIPIFIIALLFASCETYPDWKEYVSYSSVFPICGEYLVKDYDNNDNELTDYYSFYIYNKSYNPTGDSIWIDNITGHPTGSNYPFVFKIKTKADTVNLTFDADKAGIISGSRPYPLMDTIRISITNSKVFRLAKDITDPTPDSIYFKFTVYKTDQVTVKGERIVKGHRKTGWENPNYNDVLY